jgi:hypothetical protein
MSDSTLYDLDVLWPEVQERSALDPGLVTLGSARLPAVCPVDLAELTADHFNLDAMTSRVRQSLGTAPGWRNVGHSRAEARCSGL